MTAAQPAFDPMYPNSASQAYRDDFIRGAAAGGLNAIPDDVLGWAIDRAIQAHKMPWNAGERFADCYFRIQMRREPRGGYGSATAYLLKCFEEELNHG
jgi:hypothetical protein